MKVRELLEDIMAGKRYPVKLNVHLAQHALEYGTSQFKKRGLGPLKKLVPQVILALPVGSIIEVLQGGESVGFYYNNGTAWFDNGGAKVTIEKLTKQLKDMFDPEEPHEFSIMGWVPRGLHEAKKELQAEDFDAALLDLMRALKANNPNPRGGPEWRDPGPRFYGRPGREFSVRYWGDWENPPEARGEQDYDWQQPTKKTIDAVNKVVKDVQKRHKNLLLDFGIGEKNWFEFSAEPKVKKVD